MRLIKTNMFFVFLLVSICLFAQDRTRITKETLGFEKINRTAQFPSGWFFQGTKENIKIDSTVFHSGKYSLLIENKTKLKTEELSLPGTQLTELFEGKTIQVKGFLKLENVENGNAGFIIRTEGEKKYINFRNLALQNINGTAEWKEYSLEMPLTEDDRKIYIGLILYGKGKVWFDDFQILIDGKDISEAKTRKLKLFPAQADTAFATGSNITLKNIAREKYADLSLLCKVWGYLKYYHPAIAAGEYNWDYELFRFLPDYLKTKGSGERDQLLLKWIDKLGAITKAKKADEIKKENIKLYPDFNWFENSKDLLPVLVERLNNIKTAERKNSNFYFDIAAGVGNPGFSKELTYDKFPFPDDGMRLISLFRYWNIINYFFPNKHLIDGNWNDVLDQFLPRFINAKEELEYKLVLLEIIGRISDTHANIYRDEILAKFKGEKTALYGISFIENKPVVVDVMLNEKEISPLKTGDILLEIEGEKIDEIIKRKTPLYPASNYPSQLRNIAGDILRGNKDSLKVVFDRDGKILTANIKCYTPKESASVFKKTEIKSWKLLNDEIGYIYPGTIKATDIPELMKAFKNTKGIIVDMRCYPSTFIVFSLGEHFMPRPTPFVKFSGTSFKNPGLFELTQALSIGKSNEDYYKGKVVVIVNEKSQSQAEYTTMAFRAAPQATVIGSTTAGADGNISEVILPGGVQTWISGIGVYYPDGKETQRIGIVPDIEVKPTIKGIREKRDEPLDAALKVITNK